QQEILNPPDETIKSSSTSMKKRRLNLFNKTVDDEQAAIYKEKYIALITPNDTHWNSHFYCFSNILKSKVALKSNKVLKLCQLRDKLLCNHLYEALTKQEKKIYKTNITMQAQNTNLEISDNEKTNIENTNIKDIHFENSHIEDTHVKNTYIEDVYIDELNKTNSKINELVNNDLLNDNNANLDSFEVFSTMHSAKNHKANENY
ncbi:16394_t:CDS:2, partial [Cetraspora pellucida]